MPLSPESHLSIERAELEARFTDLHRFIETGFASIHRRIDGILDSVDKVDGRVQALDTRLNGRIRKLETEAVPDLETRTAVVETKLAESKRAETMIGVKYGGGIGAATAAAIAGIGWLVEHWPF